MKEFQLINVERMTELGNHHFVSPGELIASGNIHKWTKPLDKTLMGNCTMEVRLSPPDPLVNHCITERQVNIVYDPI